jgi:hypothetical protein
MAFISDILMSAGAFAAAIYCYVLSGRLRKIQTLEGGLGGAIAVLSAQVDDMTRALEKARTAATSSAGNLEGLTRRGEQVAARLELLVASMHDLPEAGFEAQAAFDAPTSAPVPETDKRLRFVRRRLPRGDVEAAE